MANRAFFSYARADGKLANWLWRQLDSYRTPKDLVGIEGKLGPVPDRLHKVFRDRDDLSAGRHLDEALQAELENSERLVVLCTPTSAKSKWVNHAVETFLRLGREDRIFPVIGSGEPDSGDPETECFPPALRGKGLLAADLREIKQPNGHVIGDGRDGGRLKLIAGMLGLEVGRLPRSRTKSFVTLASSFALVSFITFALSLFGYLGTALMSPSAPISPPAPMSPDLSPAPQARPEKASSPSNSQLAQKRAEAAAAAELLAWQTAQLENSESGYREYLSLYPNGRFSAPARQALLESQRQIPNLVWPPPTPSARYTFDRRTIARFGTLDQLDQWLTGALKKMSYEYSYYRAPGGFALVARLERITDDGAPAGGDERFLPPDAAQPFDLAKYIEQLFFAPPGYFRLIIFVVSDQPFQATGEEITARQGLALLDEGATALPEALGNETLTARHSITALIYEFRRGDGDAKIETLSPGRLAGFTHLVRSGLGPVLGLRP